MNGECSEAMRNKYAPRTYLRLKAKLTDRDGGPPFLYSYYGWDYGVWSAAGFTDTLLRWKMKPEVVHEEKKDIQ